MFARLSCAVRNLPDAKILRDELGASLVEYALIVSLIAMTCLFGLNVLGKDVKAGLTSAGGQITAAEPSNGTSHGKGSH